jgi:hypothetical protein
VILLGAFVTITPIPLSTIMLVAILTVQLKYGFSLIATIGLATLRGQSRVKPT